MESNKEFCYYFIKNLKQFILIIILLLTAIMFNMNGVRADIEGNLDTPGLGDKPPGGSTSCSEDHVSDDGFYTQFGFRLVILTIDGERIISDSYDFYSGGIDSSYGKGAGCSKIEYILGKCNSSKTRIYKQYGNLANYKTDIFDPTDNYFPKKSALTTVANYFEGDNYKNLRAMMKEMQYDCDAESIANATDKNDKCYIDNVNKTYVSVEPMLLIGDDGGNTFYFDTAYELPNVMPCWLMWHWEYLAGFKGKQVLDFKGTLDDLFSSTGLHDYKEKAIGSASNRTGLNTYNGVMVYKISDIIDIPKTGSITIKKVDQLGNSLSGAKFTLYEGEGCSTNKAITSFTVYGSKTISNLDLKKYSIKEIEAPTGYSSDTSCKNITLNESNLSPTVTFTNKKQITIYKKDTSENEIDILVKFGLYSDSYCNNQLASYTFTKHKKITLPFSPTYKYYIKELQAPNGYYGTDECIELDITKSSQNVYNENMCEHLFNQININSMEDRIWVYRYLLNNSNADYRNLLDMSKTTWQTACTKKAPNVSTTTSCLSGRYGYSYGPTFDSSDISSYNHTIEISGGIAYCRTSFSLFKNLSNGPIWYVKAGQMPIQKLTFASSIAAEGTLTQSCYKYLLAFDNDTNNPPSKSGKNTLVTTGISIPADDYFPKITLDNRVLDSVIGNNNNTTTGNFETNTRSITYYLKEVFAKIGSGDISYDNIDTKKYKSIGYGVVSKFNSEDRYSIQYSLKLGEKFPLDNKEYSSNQCIVQPTPEVVEGGELKLEFRIIDTSNPFPGSSGNNNRLVGSNWRSASLDLNGDKKVDNDDYSILQDKINIGFTSIEDFKYDINKDGKLDEKDLNYYEWVTTEYNASSNLSSPNNYSLNPYITYIMETTNNSYDKDKKGPKYTITLTPENIKKIREYNKTHKYDDFTLNCTNSDNCTMSEFSDYLTQNGIIDIIKKY